MKHQLKLLAFFLGLTAVGQVGFEPIAFAQDLLPRDNGIFSYHKPPRWRESESHPLRIAAYVVHPVGWVLREGLFRPFSYLAGSTQFTRSFFGFREPYDYREPLCFNDSDVIPDCHSVAPFSMIGKTPGGEVEPAAMVNGGTERQVFIPDVNFDFDKFNLNDLGKGRVRQISQLLSQVPSLKVVVEGHTDYKGTDEYNDKLGANRAQSVMKELSELGIDPARMSPISYGESKPVFTEEEDWARAVNRRVQFSVQGEGQALPPADKAAEAAPAAAAEGDKQTFLDTEGVYGAPRAQLGRTGVIKSVDDVTGESALTQ